MNRNLEEIRRRNLLGKREVIHKPPTALKKPPVIKVIFSHFLHVISLFIQVVDPNQVDERYRSAYDQQVVNAQKEKEVIIASLLIEDEKFLVLICIETSSRSTEKYRTR